MFIHSPCGCHQPYNKNTSKEIMLLRLMLIKLKDRRNMWKEINKWNKVDDGEYLLREIVSKGEKLCS